MTSVVHLVGSGPGDPLLLTRRAVTLLGDADVVVADRPSAEPVLALAPAAAERCYVGRSPDGPAWSTDAIADLLAARAATGQRVVRLKSGDPFVCSRGAEEVEALAARGVRCEITPGVTAATAAPLAAGAGRGATVTIASGDHHRPGAAVDWTALADPAASLVVLTGRAHQATIARQLRQAGLGGDSPAFLVHAATRPGETIVSTTLSEIGHTRLAPPATLVIGPHPGSHRAHP